MKHRPSPTQCNNHLLRRLYKEKGGQKFEVNVWMCNECGELSFTEPDDVKDWIFKDMEN